MRVLTLSHLASLAVAMAFTRSAVFPAQDAATNATGSAASRLIVGHPFVATKFAWRVRILPDGKQQFLRNERYPIRIARDADGRLMMEKIQSDNLAPECDRLAMLVPPPCPSRAFVAIDPVAHNITHWGEGEIAEHSAVEFPLTSARLEEAIESTSVLPALSPDFSDGDGEVSKTDFGTRDIDGIQAHGIRWTLLYQTNQNGEIVQRTRIHEVWTSTEMHLIVRVIDGDPNGEETIWGLEKFSLTPDATLFRPPDGYAMVYRTSAQWLPMLDHFISGDFDALHQWFAK